ncbi:hypothetical protein [Desulfitobacterium hafniense]|uniref:hypothetical protein n=1 Tax=Desulfitobacterium hafniense TaxID=49338 RepID=UPI00037A5EB1|nr:hypothetical protein [Desulfitobacterium hafniense]
MTDMTEETIEQAIIDDFEPEPIRVYVQVDSERCITTINSSAFLTDITDWIQIDEGFGDRYHHAQGNYLEKGLIDEQGCYNYKLIDGEVAERSLEEKQAEIDARPTPPPTEMDVLGQKAVELELANLELQAQNALLGEQTVNMELSNLELHQQNDILGGQIVDMDLRLLSLEMGYIG